MPASGRAGQAGIPATIGGTVRTSSKSQSPTNYQIVEVQNFCYNMSMQYPGMRLVILVGIVLVGFVFRFYNLNWDEGYHLHPDERFLAMVVNAMQIPPDMATYLDAERSGFNPANVGYDFYVYGTLPLVLGKLFALLTDTDAYGPFVQVGRALSASADLLCIVFVFLLVQSLGRISGDVCAKKKHTKLSFFLSLVRSPALPYWAAGLYALSVLPIQLSHFFAVDTFLNFFLLASVVCGLWFVEVYQTAFLRPSEGMEQGSGGFPYRSLVPLVGSAVFFGLALSSKINAVFILPLLGLILVLGIGTRRGKDGIVQMIWQKGRAPFLQSMVHAFSFTLVFGVVSYVVVRGGAPYYFQEPTFFDPTLHEQFVRNIQSLKSFEDPEAWYPPGVQWINKTPIWFSLKNMAVFGLGIPLFFFVLLGLGGVGYGLLKERKYTLIHVLFILLLLWVLSFFLYQSVQFVKALRYFIFLYPYFAAFGALGIGVAQVLLSRGGERFFSSEKGKKTYGMAQIVIFVGLLFIWPLMFLSIYVERHTRLDASAWIYRTLPDGSFLLTEHWDDPLPLLLPDQSKQFRGEQLPVFGRDEDVSKWEQMDRLLRQGDYYVLSSNRGWGSMPTVPEKYPKMTRFYADLFAERRGYEKVADFTSYPSLEYLGIPLTLPDDWADETFTVYDHPRVMIFKRK